MELKGRGEKVKEEQGGRERRKGRADYPAEAALLELQTRRRPPCTLSPHLISSLLPTSLRTKSPTTAL